MNLFRKLLKAMLCLLPILGLFGWWALDNALPYIPIKPFRSNPERQAWRLPQGARPEGYGLQAEAFAVPTRDSVTLQCLFFRADPPKNGQHALTILFLHGIGGCKEHFLPTAQSFVQQGYNVALLDLRAHGQSGGEYCTFGYEEKYDISNVLDTLLLRDSSLTIGVWGHSLGGAIALQALAHDKRLRFGVIESTFHDLQQVVMQYGENYVGFRSQWLADRTLHKAGKIAHFDPFSIKPYLSAEQVSQPIFMAHGDQDEKIPIAFGQENFRHLAAVDKEWYTVPGGRHIGLGRAGGAVYYEKIRDFLERQR